MELGKFQLRNGTYYLIINKGTGKAMQIVQSKDYRKQSVRESEPNQNNIGQIWMIEQVKPYEFQIVHALSTLVLQNDGNELRLHFGNWKTTQLYFLQKSDPKDNPHQYWIRQNKNSLRHIFFDQKLQCKQRDQDDPLTKWQLIKVFHNDTINQSCYIEYAFSNQVLDVPEASEKGGTQVIQYPINKRFNQRWVLIKNGSYYMIKNMKSNMFLDIKGQNKKQGTYIIQWKETGCKNQLWSIEQQGKRLYLIRSAMDKSLLLGVQNNSLKEAAYIVTTKSEAESLWKIVGYIPK